jgi:hypothetical protein
LQLLDARERRAKWWFVAIANQIDQPSTLLGVQISVKGRLLVEQERKTSGQ